MENSKSSPIYDNITAEMANNDRTLKELAAPNVTYQPLCIQYPELTVDLELKSGLIHVAKISWSCR